MVEVLVAAAVMIFGIATSLTTITYGMRSIDNARYQTLAGQILQSQMEKIRLLTWTQLTAATGPGNYPTFQPDVDASGATTAQLSRFTCTQSVAAAPSPFDTTMRIITLTASWTGIDGRPHSVSYLTRYGQNGLSDFFYTSH